LEIFLPAVGGEFNGELLELLEATQVVVWLGLSQSELKEQKENLSQIGKDCKRTIRNWLKL